MHLVEGLAVNAEEYRPEGEQLSEQPGRPRLFAEALARLIHEAPPAEELPDLREPLPWVGWNHDADDLWPPPDDIPENLNQRPGPAWLDDIARAARERLKVAAGTPVVGHGDWESQNIRWTGGELACVHDWDSLAVHPEPALAGAAAAVYTATGAPHTEATIEQTDAFLAEYQRATKQCWPADDVEVAWAAGLWVMAFNAKKAAVRDGPDALEGRREKLAARLARTGA